MFIKHEMLNVIRIIWERQVSLKNVSRHPLTIQSALRFENVAEICLKVSIRSLNVTMDMRLLFSACDYGFRHFACKTKSKTDNDNQENERVGGQTETAN